VFYELEWLEVWVMMLLMVLLNMNVVIISVLRSR